MIDNYIEKYKNTNEEHNKLFEFNANAIQIDNSTIRYSFMYESNYEIDVNAGIETVYENSGEIFKYGVFDRYTPIIARNISGDFELLDNHQNFTISNFDGYIIEMALDFSTSPVGISSTGLYYIQLVILDMNYNPICVILIERNFIVQ